jgi:putative tryptophan/tyrosine transport system substrate-binding protein
MKRRELITLIGGAVAAPSLLWPLAARAQQPAMPVIGFLNAGISSQLGDRVIGFQQGLKETGHVEGQNVAIKYLWAEGHYDRLPAMAADLVRRRVNVIAASPSPAAMAAKAATTTIPIVFTSGFDPVSIGLVASLNRPGGNVTGINTLSGALGAKRLELLRQLMPNSGLIALVVNQTNLNGVPDTTEIQATARAIGQELVVLDARNESDLNTAFAALTQHKATALIVGADAFLNSQRDQIVALAARHAIPTIYESRGYVLAGGLISYGTDLSDPYRLAGVYTGRILKGAKPADLPVVQPTKFELVINLKTAKTLGLTVPDKLLVAADEVIE